MKMHGRTLQGPNVVTVVLSRSNGEPNIPFRAQAILDHTPFDKLVPEVPVALKQRAGRKEREVDFDNEDYLKLMAIYKEKYSAWCFITSMAATPGLEWETVDPVKPETWLNYEAELRKAGISKAEMGVLWAAVNEANGLSEDKMKEARDLFLQQEAADRAKASTPG